MDPVDALVELGRIGGLRGVAKIIAHQARAGLIGGWKILQQFHRDRADARLRDGVPGKRTRRRGDSGGAENPGLRIENVAARAGEIPVAHGIGRHRGADLRRQPVPQLFQVRHEKEPVLAVEDFRDRDRAAQSEAVLVAAERILGALRLQPLPRVERGVPQKFERRAVVIIGAGFGSDVDLGRAAAKLGRVNAGLHLELLDRIHGRADDPRIPVRVRVLHAVERIAIELEALSGDRERGLSAQSPQAVGASGASFGGDVGAQGDELEIVSPVERQLDDALVFDHRSQRGCFGGEQRRSPGHLHRLADFTNLEIEIDARYGADFELHALSCRDLEPGSLGADIIEAGNQEWRRVGAGLVGNHPPGLARCQGGDGNGGAGDGGSRGIGDSAGDFSGILSAKRRHHSAQSND